MDVRVLGPVEVLGPAGFVSLGGRKQRTVLALLVVAGRRATSVDRLIDGVWGDQPPPGARSTVQTYVSNLRAALDGDIQHRGDSYALRLRRAEVDAARFEDGVAAGRRLLGSRPVEAAARLAGALAEWRGPPFEDVVQHELIHAEATRLEATRLAALEDRIDADLASGRHAEVIPELDVLVERHPLRERFCAQHMLALYRGERQADALRSYRRASRELGALGIEPSPALQELELMILRHDASLPLQS